MASENENVLAKAINELAQEIRSMKESNLELIRHTGNAAKQLERWDYGGLPAERRND